MKKLTVVAGALCLALSVNVNSFAVVKPSTIVTAKKGEGWEKSKESTWMGKDKMWYKLDKDAKVWMSKDGKKWDAAKDGMWQDKDGKWLKIVDDADKKSKTLKWSADGGKTWSDVPEWKWEGPDGTWYKFDKDWTVWTMMAKK